METNEKEVCLIDKFLIPVNSVEEFAQRMDYNRKFIKNHTGFIKDEVYEQRDDNGNLTIITIAVWQSYQDLDQAKNSVQTEYKRIAFNPVEFYQRLNIKMERGIYSLYHE